MVLHKCDNPKCVRPSHLRDGTHADNVADCRAKGRSRDLHGDAHPRVKLSEDQVEEIKFLLSKGVGVRELGRRYGVYHTCISSIKLGKHRVHG